jgi:hypothetical protein
MMDTKYKRWAEPDDALLRNYYSDYSSEQLVKLIGRSEDSISYRAWKLSLKKSVEYVSHLHKELHGKRQYSLDESAFSCIDTEEKAYFLGLIYADGCVDIIDRKAYTAYRLRYDINNKDIELMHGLLKCLGSEDRPIYHRESKHTISIEINSKILVQDLMKQGVVPNKSTLGIFPRGIQGSLFNHFIRGVFDGDGCISICGKIPRAFISGHPIFCIWVKENLTELLQVKGSVTTRPTYGGWSLGGRNQVPIFARWLYKNANFYLKRKHDKFIKESLL